jgi:leukotriene-A4 hydrolase
MTRAFALLLIPSLLLAACVNPPAQPAAAAPVAPEPLDVNRDYHSYANTADFRTEHVQLELTVDFARRVLDGSVELQLMRLTGAGELVLDTRDLDIASVETDAGGHGTWAPTTFAVGARDAILGSPLRIAMPATADRVRIKYTTRPEASGLQWVTPEQTAGRKRPFLYSQSQAIHARSWIPLQDTPQVRSTYEARIRTPKELFAVMSAVNRPDAKRDGDYAFAMPQPVPAYLIALAVGDIRFRPVGRRTGVYAEPSMVRGAAYEFEETEKMVEACEKLFGPYRWGRYDMLILPPSFPYGGMENPRLTFLTPTSVVGDRSGVSLIAHELAHSWSGNMVTNATWRDFWLNEGTTTYLTYRIMDEVYGKRRGAMERMLGQQDLVESFEQAAKEGDKALAYDQRNRDPDEVFSSITSSAARSSTPSCAAGSTTTPSRARPPRTSSPTSTTSC